MGFDESKWTLMLVNGGVITEFLFSAVKNEFFELFCNHFDEL